eukprot:jgi/Psemu1/4347/gm1.4347_g
MTTSRSCNKCQTKSPSDVTALGTILGNDSQAARPKNHDVPPPPKKSCNSQTPANGAPKYISQDHDHISGEALETVARTNAEVGVQALPEDDSQAAGTNNHIVPPPPKKSCNSQTPSKGALKYISDDNDVPEEASETAARTNAEVGVQALPEDDSQAARTKTHAVPLPPKMSRNSQTPSKGSPKYSSKDNDVPEEASKTAARTNKVPAVPNQVLGTFSDEFSGTVPKPNAEETSTYLYKDNTISFRRKFGLPKSLEVCGKESWIGTEWSDVCKYGVCEGLKFRCFNLFYSIDVKGLHSHLYYCNVANYVTIKKYMILYLEILVWCMENVKYPPAHPEKMDQGWWFYTKRDDGSSHDAWDYVPVMKQFLNDLIANSALWV